MLEGKYRLNRLLGEGGMGVVVAATHIGLDQRVAIKFLHPEATRNKEAVERFQREAKVAAKVKSEHVTRVHDVGRAPGNVPYIVMEHLEGIDLGDLIDREGRLPVEEACESCSRRARRSPRCMRLASSTGTSSPPTSS